MVWTSMQQSNVEGEFQCVSDKDLKNYEMEQTNAEKVSNLYQVSFFTNKTQHDWVRIQLPIKVPAVIYYGLIH